MWSVLARGPSLFHDGSLWAAHVVLGFSLVLPIGIVSTLAFLRPTGGRRLWAALLLLAYGVQIALAVAADAASSGIAQALHVANAGFVLLSAFALAQQHGSHRAAA